CEVRVISGPEKDRKKGSIQTKFLIPTTKAPVKEEKVSPPAPTVSPPTPRQTRMQAATELLKRCWAGYQANPDDSDIPNKYLQPMVGLLQETVTDGKMSTAFSSLDVDERRTAEERCREALWQVRRIQVAFRTGYPSLKDERTWQSAIGAMSMAQRDLDMILNYRPPIPLKDGWHLITDEQGTVLGYLYLSLGYHEIRDETGKFIESGEIPLERPLIDPIDIVAGGIAGVARGALRSAISTLLRRAAPRVGAAALRIGIGVAEAAPIAAGRVAPSAFISAELLSSKAVPTLVVGAESSVSRSA